MSKEEREYWLRTVRQRTAVLAGDHVCEVTSGRYLRVTDELSPLASGYALDLAHLLGGVSAADLTLAALGCALTQLGLLANDQLTVWFEGHGREHVPNADLLVGWYTSMLPVRLRLPDNPLVSVAMGVATSRLEAFRLGRHFWARREHPEIGSVVRGLPAPRVSFNYLGVVESTGDAWSAAQGELISTANELSTLLDVTAWQEAGRVRFRLAADRCWMPRKRIEALANRMRDLIESAARLVEMTPGKVGEPGFIVHPVNGQVDWYRELGRQCRRRLVAIAQDPHDATLEVADQARSLADSLESQVAASPLRLAGWSFGSIIAFETAKELERRNRSVTLLLVDPPPCWKRAASYGLPDLEPLPDHLEKLVGFRPTIRVAVQPPEADWGQVAEQVIEQVLEQVRRRRPTGVGGSLDLLARRVSLIVRNNLTVQRWAPDGAVQRITVIWSSETASAGLAETEAWRAAAGQSFSSTVLDGTHVGLLESVVTAKQIATWFGGNE
jgi:pimeloyl-ACP methyl ester carboxylesterase